MSISQFQFIIVGILLTFVNIVWVIKLIDFLLQFVFKLTNIAILFIIMIFFPGITIIIVCISSLDSWIDVSIQFNKYLPRCRVLIVIIPPLWLILSIMRLFKVIYLPIWVFISDCIDNTYSFITLIRIHISILLLVQLRCIFTSVLIKWLILFQIIYTFLTHFLLVITFFIYIFIFAMIIIKQGIIVIDVIIYREVHGTILESDITFWVIELVTCLNVIFWLIRVVFLFEKRRC